MSKVTSRDGTQIAYYVSGSGRPLLLVHGATADHTRWALVSPYLERHFSVYAMDRRGRGGSGDSPHYNFLREAEDVAAVVDAIDEPVFLLGHSYGATCCLEGALLTGNVCRLILYEPDAPTDLPAFPQEILDRIQALIDGCDYEAALEVTFRELVGMPDHEFEIYRRLPVWQTRIRLAPTIPRELRLYSTYRFDPQRFAGLQVPAMLLLGGDSAPLDRQATDLVHSALPNSRIVILPGERHIAMDTNPELFVEKVLGFLLE
jgi:pimeloyl-ACP methyl ester carboxylesterase